MKEKGRKSKTKPALARAKHTEPKKLPAAQNAYFTELKENLYRRVSPLWKGRREWKVWAFVFWGWVVWVSLWIDNAPAELIEEKPVPKFSNIEFAGMRFEQIYEDNSRVIVHTPRARFDQASKKLFIDEPQLRWEDKRKNQAFSASAQQGEIESIIDEVTSLPSEFGRLHLVGNAVAESKTSNVQSEEMFFYCGKRIFYCPAEYTLQHQNGAMRGRGMYYDPETEKMGNPAQLNLELPK